MRITEILFWFFILFSLALLAWRLIGSPEVEAILIGLVGSHIALWREFGLLRTQVARMETKLDLIWNEFRKRKRI